MAYTTTYVTMYENAQAIPQTKYANIHKPCSGLLEDIGVNVHHEIATTGVLHHKEDMGLGLEAAAQVDQEWVLHGIDSFKDPLL